MASAGSLYSGSPESKSTLDTPENGPYENLFNFTTPSDLHLSRSEDSYAEWKSLPSRLLESPSPIITPIQFRPLKYSLERMMEGTKTRNCTFDVSDTVGKQNHHFVDSVEGFTLVSNGSSPSSAIARHYLENLNADNKTSQSTQVLNDMFSTCNKYLPDWSPEPTELSPTSTRHLKICNISPTTHPIILYETFQEFGDIQEFYTQKLHPERFCVVSYFDTRDSMAAFLKLHVDHSLEVQFCPSGYVPMLVMGSNLSGQATNYRSDVMCIVTSGGHSSNIRRILYYVLSDFGAISKFTALENSCPPAFLVSFFDTRDAFDIIDTLDGQYVEGFRLTLSFYDSDSLTCNPTSSALRTRRDENGRVHIVASQDSDMGMLSPQLIHPAGELSSRPDSGSSVDSGFSVGRDSEKLLEAIYSGGYVTQKRSGLTTVNLKQNSATFRRPPPTPQPDPRHFQEAFSYLPSNKSHGVDINTQDIIASAPLSFPFQLFGSEISPTSNSERLHGQIQVPGKNVIDMERIARGLDTRTTVMLRNIPNKVDQQTLKDYVDTTSRGLYNFLYLRIDFRNICNVGYAFINFIDPLDIIDFVKAKSGTRWNKFNSEKVLDVTYANIQGIDQLVEKFRNSSVMDQDPTYRPKLFHSSGPLAGTEKEFPPANNILKKCRSISAAQQIGLFAPKISASGKGVWRKRE